MGEVDASVEDDDEAYEAPLYVFSALEFEYIMK